MVLKSVQAAIRAFREEHDVLEGLMPTNQQLVTAGRTDLKILITRLGGMKRVAASMDLVFSTAQYPTIGLGVEAMQQFVQQHKQDPSTAPSFNRLHQAGRFDLVTSYKKFGYARVLRAAGMTTGKHGLPKGTATTKDLVCKCAA